MRRNKTAPEPQTRLRCSANREIKRDILMFSWVCDTNGTPSSLALHQGEGRSEGTGAAGIGGLSLPPGFACDSARLRGNLSLRRGTAWGKWGCALFPLRMRGGMAIGCHQPMTRTIGETAGTTSGCIRPDPRTRKDERNTERRPAEDGQRQNCSLDPRNPKAHKQ